MKKYNITVNGTTYEVLVEEVGGPKTPALGFGMGIERIVLLKYHIDDMRLLYENDVRFLRQF